MVVRFTSSYGINRHKFLEPRVSCRVTQSILVEHRRWLLKTRYGVIGWLTDLFVFLGSFSAAECCDSMFTNKKINVVLDETNFLLWKQQVLLAIHSHRLERLLTGAMQSPPEITVDEDGSLIPNEAYDDFIAQDSVLASWLLSTISPHLLSQFVGAETVISIWVMVLQYFATRSSTSVMSLHCKLQSLKKGEDNMWVYIDKVKEICDALASCESPIPLVGHIASILKRLPREYQSFMAVIMSSGDMLPFANCWLCSSRINGYGCCSYCSSQVENEACRVFSANFVANTTTYDKCACMYSSKGYRLHDSTGADKLVVEQDQWVIDFGATHHVTPYTSVVTRKTGCSGPGTLVVGDGALLPVNLVGSTFMKSASRVLLVNDLLHVPGITQNFLSVSKFARDNNVVLEFYAQGCCVRDAVNGEVILQGRMEEGLYVFPSTTVSRVVQSDWGGEYRSLSVVLVKEGIVHCVACQIHRSRIVLSKESIDTSLSLPCPQHKGYMCLAVSGRIYVSRHVIFDEFTFPFARVAGSSNTSVSNKQRYAKLEEAVNAGEDSVDGNSGHLGQIVVDMGETSLEAAAQQDINEEGGEVGTAEALEPTNQRKSVAVTGSLDNVSHLRDDNDASYLNRHSMLKKSKCRIFKPKLYMASYDDMKPLNIHEAIKSPHWRATFHVEIEALRRNGTWTLVKLPEERSVVGCKWLFKLKKNPDGSISSGQICNVECSPFTSCYEWLAPPGFEQVAADGSPLVCRLKKVLYGLREAPQNWHDKLKKCLVKIRFKKFSAYTSLFVCWEDGQCVYILMYVDDIVLTGSSNKQIEEVVKLLGSEFALKDLGDLHYFLGIEDAYEYRSIVVKRILRYLVGIINHGLVIAPAVVGFNVVAFADTDWAANIDDRKSVSGYCAFVGDNLVMWNSKKQKSVSRSTMEAEYRSVVDVNAETTWVNALLSDLGVASKHVEVDVHFVHEKVALKQVLVNYVPGSHQVADGFTMPLVTARFEVFKARVNVQSTFLWEEEEEVGRMLNDEVVS
ncbi:hypothetical protein F3Y22_tig00111207pilonHSYRG00167 [Hibiscus syriacus]|uniref:Uncharacterized protein n=1 Tax=Hibiscus syriacus TaxID=106335 RepID=A0A6A2YWU4_HIBSY|nr:hypothetical protein F3Y22_tig00111207pilonHSYRG00167 [Hibiscus syriacus]